MPRTSQDMVAEAEAAVERIDRPTAERLIAEEDALVVDVRDAAEGRAQRPGGGGAPRLARDAGVPRRRGVEVPRPRAAPRPPGDPLLRLGRARAALSGKALREMGYERVYNLGGFAQWAEAGGAVEPAEG